MEFITIRHAQHAASEFDPICDDVGLTEMGIKEARQIGTLIKGRKISKAYTFDSSRALSTVALALDNTLPPEKVPARARHYLQSRRMEINHDFEYLPIYPGRYQDRLFASFAEDRQMAFTVFESDKYQSRQRPVSTYSAMAKVGAQSVLRYFEEGRSGQVAACAREFVFASLVARLVAEKGGEGALSNYVEWYTRNIEAKDSARLTTISFKKKMGRSAVGVEVISDYGNMVFDYAKLQKTAANPGV